MSYITEITKSDLEALDDSLDRIWAELGIDIVFTKHFADRFDRVEHGNKPVTPEEVYELFAKIQKKHGNKIKHLGTDMEAVMSDLSSNLNVPFAINDNPRFGRRPDEPRYQLVGLSMMKKKGFKPHKPMQKHFKVENNNNRHISEKEKDTDDKKKDDTPKKKPNKKGGNDEIKLSNFDPSIYPFIKRALYRYPTAHNEIEALAKLVQDLDSRVKSDGDEMNDIESDLNTNDSIQAQNSKFIKDILERLYALEERVYAPEPQLESYSFLRAESTYSQKAETKAIAGLIRKVLESKKKRHR